MNLVFVGGVHGIGKTTLCSTLSRLTGATHLTAGTLIRQSKLETASSDKTVSDVLGNQEHLVSAVERCRHDLKALILDGHFCLLRPDGSSEAIELGVFRRLSPSSIIVLTAKSSAIAKRLKERDGKTYSDASIDSLQDQEVSHATAIARELGVQILVVEDSHTPEEIARFIEVGNASENS